MRGGVLGGQETDRADDARLRAELDALFERLAGLAARINALPEGASEMRELAAEWERAVRERDACIARLAALAHARED